MRTTSFRNTINDPVFLERGLGVVLWATLIVVLVNGSLI